MHLRRFTLLLFRFIFAVVVLTTGLHAAPQCPLTRIRTADVIVRQIVDRGYVSSPSFERLVDRIDASDLIVYIERRLLRSQRLAGMTQFLVRAGGVRYVRIAIDSTLVERESAAILGHELQHAVEIAEAEWAVDHATVQELFRRIGHQSSGGLDRYDTDEAVVIGQRVGRELVGAAVPGGQ